MKELNADVIVVSAGTAGLAAAVTAAEGGAKVVAFEKSGRTGGTAIMGSGIFAVESRIQKIKQMALTREEAFKIYMDFCHWHVNARLVKALIDKSADTIDWLEKMGVQFFDISSHGIGNYHTQHTVEAPEFPDRMIGRAAKMMQVLEERAVSLGVTILLKTPVGRLIREESRVTGVFAREESGEEIRASAGAVILATGGHSIGALPGMVAGIGDGIRMAKEIGAAVQENGIPDRGQREVLRPPFAGRHRKGFSSLLFAFQQPVLVVNRLGERFMNEELMLNVLFHSNAINRQPERLAFVIFDEDTKNIFKKAFDIVPGGAQQPFSSAPDFDSELSELLQDSPEVVVKAESIEELCQKTGIDQTGLWLTLREYNYACDTGRDETFNKSPRYLKPVRKPPFYASRITGRPSPDWSGIKVNYKTEVLDSDCHIIPGLYAAGMDIACELYHDTYPIILPATAMGFALHSGRIAAENALRYLKNV